MITTVNEMSMNFLDPNDICIEKDCYNKIGYRQHSTGDRLENVELKLMFPLSKKANYVSIYHEGNEVGVIQDYKSLPAQMKNQVKELVDGTYFIPNINKIYDIKEQYGLIHWKVNTDRGVSEFFTRNRKDVVVKEKEVYIRDIDGNRYTILDYTGLDSESIKKLHSEI